MSDIRSTSRSPPTCFRFGFKLALVVYSVVGLDDLEMPGPEFSLIFGAVVVVAGRCKIGAY